MSRERAFLRGNARAVLHGAAAHCATARPTPGPRLPDGYNKLATEDSTHSSRSNGQHQAGIATPHYGVRPFSLIRRDRSPPSGSHRSVPHAPERAASDQGRHPSPSEHRHLLARHGARRSDRSLRARCVRGSTIRYGLASRKPARQDDAGRSPTMTWTQDHQRRSCWGAVLQPRDTVGDALLDIVQQDPRRMRLGWRTDAFPVPAATVGFRAIGWVLKDGVSNPANHRTPLEMNPAVWMRGHRDPNRHCPAADLPGLRVIRMHLDKWDDGDAQQRQSSAGQAQRRPA